MNTRQAVLLIAAIGVGALFQSGCGESRKRQVSPPKLSDTTSDTAILNTAADSDTQKSGPKIEVTKPVFDFGVVGPGKKVQFQFAFKNVGAEELVIDRIISTCQCTVPELKKKNYAPGESGVVEGAYLSSTMPGKVEKFLHILSNDKSNPRCELTIKGRVELQVVAEPDEAMELFLNRPNGGARPIKLRSKDGKAFAIRNFSSTQNTLSAKFDPKEEKKEFVITPTVDVAKLKSNLTGSIQIGLTHPDTHQLTLSYVALPMYVITPPRLIVQEAEPGKPIDRELWVKNNYDDKVEIETITSQNGCMEVVEQQHQGSNVKMIVRITPPPQEGHNQRYMSDRLTIKMTDGDEVSITCSGWYKLNALK